MDRQGLTGAKTEYRSIPYRSITQFSVESAGNFDLDAELRIWVTGRTEPIQKQFNKKVNIYDVQALLTSYIAR